MSSASSAEMYSGLQHAFQIDDTRQIHALLDRAGRPDDEQTLLLLLYKGLAHPDTEIQQKSAALVQPHLARMTEALQALLNHPNENIRYWALSLLGNGGRLSRDELAAVLGRTEKDETKILAADLLFAGPESPETFELLIRHLGDPSWALRRHLNKRLMPHGEKLLPAIRTVFAGGNLHQKYWALKLLIDLSGPKAMQNIRKFLTSKDFTVKLYAIAALEYVQGDQALGFLFSTLMEESPVMRYQAAHIFAAKGEPALKEAVRLIGERGPELKDDLNILTGRILGERSRIFYREQLESPDPDDRFYALRAIGQNPDQESIRILVQAFRDPVWIIRRLASDLLARLIPQAREELIAALNDPSFDTIFWATKTLGAGRDASAARPLLTLVDHHPDPNVRVCAVKALCKLDVEYVAELLILNFRDAPPSVRTAISEGLVQMSRLKIVKYLVIYLFDRDKSISFWCEKTLKALQYPALASLLGLLVTLDPVQQEKFISFLHHLKPEQLHAILKRDKVTMADFDPDRLTDEEYVLVPLSQYRTLDDLLAQLKEQHGSDLHLNVGLPPMFRIHGELTRTNLPPITEERASQLILSIFNEEQLERFKTHWEIDFSHEVKHVGRFRANIFRQRQGVSGVFRLIPTQIPTFEELGLQRPVFESLCENRNGLILVTGPTGSGKSTTMAVMVDYINKSRHEHILTIEDPIEFVHQHKRCSINQRELGTHTHSFADALRSSLREDPDVILVGEMRDPETIKLALTASETGHLVFSTLHTISASESINRIIGAFPADHQDQVRLELAGVLRAIISQKLLPRSDRKGRVLAHEMLICNIAVRNLIKEAKTEQIVSIMQTAAADHMQTMDQALARLAAQEICSVDTVMPHVQDKKSFTQLVQSVTGKPGTSPAPATPVAHPSTVPRKPGKS
ncbi:MAG TPA: PilT/PilU family type 4a pilus ATPase [Candidatus Ozemobacteraceae bacterium]